MQVCIASIITDHTAWHILMYQTTKHGKLLSTALEHGCGRLSDFIVQNACAGQFFDLHACVTSSLSDCVKALHLLQVGKRYVSEQRDIDPLFAKSMLDALAVISQKTSFACQACCLHTYSIYRYLQSHATHVNVELKNVEDVKDVACVEELLSRSKVFRDTHEECLGCIQKFAHVVTVDSTVDTKLACSCHPGTILVQS